MAKQVGEALDYTDDGRTFSRKLTSDWSDELVEGADFRLVTGDDLATIKAALGSDVVDPRTPSLLLLTESGVFAAALLSRQPKAKALRRWLSADVLPQLRQTGTYQITDRPTAVALPFDRAALLAEIREELRPDLDVAHARADAAHALAETVLARTNAAHALAETVLARTNALQAAVARVDDRGHLRDQMAMLAATWRGVIGDRPVALAELPQQARVSPAMRVVLEAVCGVNLDLQLLLSRLEWSQDVSLYSLAFEREDRGARWRVVRL